MLLLHAWENNLRIATIQKTIVNTDTVIQRNATDIYRYLFLYNSLMVALVKQLLEADGFLHNVQTLPSFHRVQELQLHKLKDYMNKKTIDDQSFAESSHAVDKMRHFDQEQKQQSSNALWMPMTGLWPQRKRHRRRY